MDGGLGRLRASRAAAMQVPTQGSAGPSCRCNVGRRCRVIQYRLASPTRITRRIAGSGGRRAQLLRKPATSRLRVTRKLAPPPRRPLAPRGVRPSGAWSSMMRLTTARPIPAPCVRVVKNSSKMRGRRLRDPGPLVVDGERDVAVRRRSTRDRHGRPRGARLQRVAHQVPEHLPHLRAVAARERLAARARRSVTRDVRAARGVRRQRHDLARERRDVGRLGRGGARPREVEHVADEVVQPARLALHDVAEAPVLVGERRRLAEHLDRAA